MLPLEGGSFAIDVFFKLGRKFDNLMSKFVALELSYSEIRKDLTSSQEDMSAWKAWNSRLPPKHRRWELVVFDKPASA
ncbi:hypothetical protein N7540_011384 [Penicillium herquei]|nr:hypothetical protein N7540_011384 [Penicillium herquei]